MFLAANFSIHKFGLPAVREYFTKYMKRSLLSVNSIRNQQDEIYHNVLKEIRLSIGEHYIWISLDKTTDSQNQYIVLMIVGVMTPTMPTIPHLLHLEVVEKVNNQSMVWVFNKALTILYPQGIKYEKVLLLISDADSYIILAAKCHKLCGYIKLLLVTCVAHGIQRVCEEIREQNPEVNSLISSVKRSTQEFHCRQPPASLACSRGLWLLYMSKHFQN